MVKIIIFLLINISIFANENLNVYEKNCVSCHNSLPVSIDKYFYRYLLKYSGEEQVKKSIFSYLKNPSKKTTIMPLSFIERFGVKNKTILSDDELKDAIDIYWDKYQVFNKLQ